MKDYRPVSLITIVSKLFERDRTVFNSDVRKMENALDRTECAGTILTDLSETFDCLNRDLLIAKLDALKRVH